MNLISLISLAKSYGISHRMQAGNLYPNEFELPCMDVNSLTWQARKVKHIPVDTLGIEPRAFRMHHLYPNEFACPLYHMYGISITMQGVYLYLDHSAPSLCGCVQSHIRWRW